MGTRVELEAYGSEEGIVAIPEPVGVLDEVPVPRSVAAVVTTTEGGAMTRVTIGVCTTSPFITEGSSEQGLQTVVWREETAATREPQKREVRVKKNQ